MTPITIAEANHLLRCGVTQAHIRELQAETRPTAAMRATAAFMQTKLSVLVLYGLVGTGKTLAACRWLLNAKVWDDDEHWHFDHERAQFVSASKIFGLNTRFGPDRDEFYRLLRARWLVVDDLGTETDTGLTDEFFTERCARAGRTVITTNIDCPTPARPESTFTTRYRARVASRMVQSGMFAGTGTQDLRRVQR